MFTRKHAKMLLPTVFPVSPTPRSSTSIFFNFNTYDICSAGIEFTANNSLETGLKMWENNKSKNIINNSCLFIGNKKNLGFNFNIGRYNVSLKHIWICWVGGGCSSPPPTLHFSKGSSSSLRTEISYNINPKSSSYCKLFFSCPDKTKSNKETCERNPSPTFFWT